MKNECNKLIWTNGISFRFSIGQDGTVRDEYIEKTPMIGFLHSDTGNGKWTKAQKRFVKIEGNSARYLGNKRFIKPICKLA